MSLEQCFCKSNLRSCLTGAVATTNTMRCPYPAAHESWSWRQTAAHRARDEEAPPLRKSEVQSMVFAEGDVVLATGKPAVPGQPWRAEQDL